MPHSDLKRFCSLRLPPDLRHLQPASAPPHLSRPSFTALRSDTLTPVQCLAEAFDVDPDAPESAKTYSIAPATLPSIFNVFLKTKSRSAAASAAAGAGASADASAASAEPAVPAAAPTPAGPSAADKNQAEALKVQGNALMGKKDLAGAIDKYTQAIALDDSNPVYFSNRAAAHGAKCVAVC